jgi:hypothetical protein
LLTIENLSDNPQNAIKMSANLGKTLIVLLTPDKLCQQDVTLSELESKGWPIDEV